MKKYIIGSFVVIGAIYLGVKFIAPTQEGKEMASLYISESEKNDIDCNYVGFAEKKDENLSWVYTSCYPRKDLPVKSESTEQLIKVLEEYVVSPSIKAIPKEEVRSLVVIVQIADQVVSCTEVKNQAIVSSWYDSYENYCLPN